MALVCFESIACLQRSARINLINSYRSLLLYEAACENKKKMNVNVKYYRSNEIQSYSHDVESSRNRPLEEVTSYKTDTQSDEEPSTLEEPTTCCMSGCANCVWIHYAEELCKQYKDGGEKAREAIMKMEDQNMKAFLLTELKVLTKD